MIEANRLQLRDARGVQADGRGNEVGVEPGVMRAGNDLDQVAARRRFAPDRCTGSTPMLAASWKTRIQVAVSISSAR